MILHDMNENVKDFEPSKPTVKYDLALLTKFGVLCSGWLLITNY